MRTQFVLFFAAVLFGGSASAEESPAVVEDAKELSAPQTIREKASYGIGRRIGNQLRSEGVNVHPGYLLEGIADALKGKELVVSQEELREAMMTFQQQRRQALSQRNKREGESFLKGNKEKEGVVVLPSGLQYEVLQSGDGASPTLDDKVRAHYHGTFINGTVFDSSVRRGESAVFPVGGVIKGWVEALQLMHVGDKWRLYVPSELAYGDSGFRQAIGPNATLIFEVELLGIE